MLLKNYLRDLKEDERRLRLARACGSSWSYLRLVAYGARQPSLELALRIELETSGAVLVEDLVRDVDRVEALHRFVALRASMRAGEVQAALCEGQPC